MSARLLPLTRGVRIGLATAATSRAVLGATLCWLALLAAVYAADAGPVLPALATTAALLFPVAAWATAAHLAAGSEDVGALLTAAAGRPVALLLDAAPALLWLVAATSAGVGAAAVFDPHPAPPGQWLLGAGLHLLSGLVGVSLGLVLHALRLTRGAQTLLVVAAGLTSVLVPLVPPVQPLLQAFGHEHHGGSEPQRLWALLGPVCLAAALTALTAALRRRRV